MSSTLTFLLIAILAAILFGGIAICNLMSKLEILRMEAKWRDECLEGRLKAAEKRLTTQGETLEKVLSDRGLR
jgi:hypothetical protein